MFLDDFPKRNNGVFPHVQEKIRGEGENFLRKSRTVSVLFCSNMTKRKTPQPDYAALASGQSLKSVSRNSSGNLPNPLEVPDSSTGTGMRRKLGQLQAVDLLTLLRNLDPSQRFYNHTSGANKVFRESFAKLLDMRKPSHLMLGQICPETTKTWIGKLSRGSQALVELRTRLVSSMTEILGSGGLGMQPCHPNSKETYD